TKGAKVGLFGLVGVPLLQVSIAQKDEQESIPLLLRSHSVLDKLYRIVNAAFRQQQTGQLVRRFHISRVKPQHLPELRNGILRGTLQSIKVSQIHMGADKAAIGAQGLSKQRLGLL